MRSQTRSMKRNRPRKQAGDQVFRHGSSLVTAPAHFERHEAAGPQEAADPLVSFPIQSLVEPQVVCARNEPHRAQPSTEAVTHGRTPAGVACTPPPSPSSRSTGRTRRGSVVGPAITPRAGPPAG
jgi:hypothetical protein